MLEQTAKTMPLDRDLGIDYAKEMDRIRKEMKELLVREAESRKMLEDAFYGIGYGIGTKDSGSKNGLSVDGKYDSTLWDRSEYIVAENRNLSYGREEKESE